MRRSRFQSCVLLFLAGAVMTLGFAPFHCWPLLFLSLPIFYVLLSASVSTRQACWRSFWFGYGYSIAGTWWISNALLVDASKFGWMVPFSVLGLSAVMALWFVVLGWLTYKLRSYSSLILFAVLWTLVEYLRSVGMFGFPWNLVGYMSLASLPVAQMASLVGTYGLSFILVLVGVVPAYYLSEASIQRKVLATVLGIALIGACYSFGAQRLETPVESGTVLLRLVQPNIPQAIKGTMDGQDVSVAALGDLTNAPGADGREPDFTIWPETAYPFTVRGAENHAVPKKVKLLLTGAMRAEGFKPNMKIWNSLIAMNGKGQVLASYDKSQLVPFGEFVPLRSVLPLDKITPGDIDFSRGGGPTTMKLAGVPPFSPLICYEGIFPWLAIDSADRPEWMLNVTNDGWYGDSPGPYQHFDMVRMRAIEQGLPLVRAANSGISAVVDPYGRIVAALLLNQRAIVDVLLPKYLPATPYSYFMY